MCRLAALESRTPTDLTRYTCFEVLRHRHRYYGTERVISGGYRFLACLSRSRFYLNEFVFYERFSSKAIEMTLIQL